VRFWGMFRFTVEEAMRRGTLIFYFIIATIILLLLALGIGHPVNDSDMVTLFGSPLARLSQQGLNVVEFLLIQLHSLSIFWIILLGMFGVAGLIPSMLEKGMIDLFLSKPLTRAELLMARALGAVSGIVLNLIYLFLGVWLIFGLRLGVWHWGFLSSTIYVVYAFVCFFSIVTIVGLITRSATFSIMLSFIFTLISWGLEVRENGLYRLWDNVIYHRLLDALYYLTPQLNAMLENSTRVIGKLPYIPNAPDFTFMPFIYSFFSSCLLYFLSIWYFSRQDY
jgi:ABC-type transport system involved in multi-copper enzyme maturation permease subunit